MNQRTKIELSRDETLLLIAELAERTSRFIRANPGDPRNTFVVENVTENVLRMKKLLEDMS